MEQIKVGDLVVVYKPKPCGCVGVLGSIFTVKEVGVADTSYCLECKKPLSSTSENYAMFPHVPGGRIPFTRLKKIPPLSDDEELEFLQSLTKSEEHIDEARN